MLLSYPDVRSMRQIGLILAAALAACGDASAPADAPKPATTAIPEPIALPAWGPSISTDRDAALIFRQRFIFTKQIAEGRRLALAKQTYFERRP